MRNKILMIAAMLAVMVAMTGIAAASPGGSFLPGAIVIDIDGTPLPIEYKLWDINTSYQDVVAIRVYKDSDRDGIVDAGEVVSTVDDLQFDWNNDGTTWTTPVDGSYFTVNSATYNNWNLIEDNTPTIGEQRYIKNLQVRDNPNNANAQLGDKYFIKFYGKNNQDYADFGAEVADSYATMVPEFPTVALPVAAVIGLVFLFQQKKKKEE